MTELVQNIIGRLTGVRQTGETQWEARCPAHDDRHASLSVSHGDDGRVLLHCHAGCSPMAVCQAMGIRLAAGRTVTDPVSLMDLGPTLADLTGSPALPQADGRSLWPLLQGRPPQPADVFSEFFVHRFADDGPQGGPARMTARRRHPNILCFMSDEHNTFVTSCYGNGIVRTPNLDRLAADGVTFDAAYTTSPLCVPARLSFTAGKYVSRCGAWNNDSWLASDDVPSLPRILNAAGYDSVLCGKMHYDRTRRYGFRDITPELHSNQSDKMGRGARRKGNTADVNLHERDHRFADFHPGGHSEILDHDRIVTRHAVTFLRERDASEQPFFMLVGHLAPHFPLIVPKSYWQHYCGKVPMPVIPEGHLESQPLNYQHLRRGFGLVETDPALVRKGRELYYGLTEWFDNEVGKVLAALTDSDVADDTIVIYTSDHGENMGEHGLWWKNCMYEHAARAPLIVSWPARWKGGQRRSQVCSLVDLVQTIADLGGADVPSDWDGASLCGVLDDGGAKWRDVAVSEYYGHNTASGMSMLRQGRYKYVYHSPADGRYKPDRELYDLQVDPGEFTDLAIDSAHAKRVERMHRRLVKELGREPDECERMCRRDFATGYAR